MKSTASLVVRGLVSAKVQALNLVYPRRAVCIACGEKSGCAVDDLCLNCAKLLDNSRLGAHACAAGSVLSGRFHAFYYAGVAGSMVRALKYQGMNVLAAQMALDMAQACRHNGSIDVITGVPMHFYRKYRRGENQSEVLARAVSGALAVPYRDLIVRTRHTRQQAVLTGIERMRNLDNAFRARENLQGQAVLLVDDVYTTGTTAERCAEVLLGAGASKVYVLTYAVSE